MSNKSFEAFLSDGGVYFWGHQGPLPDFTSSKKKGIFSHFVRGDAGYTSLSDIREKGGDVHFLDHEATKVLAAHFPTQAHYIAVRVMPRAAWVVSLPGLVRRLWLRHIEFERFVRLPASGTFQWWAVFRHRLAERLSDKLSLSSTVGISGLTTFLNKSRAAYVALRFYEKLPELHRVGGDLDLLVSDRDDEAVRAFLNGHPGEIPVHVFTPHRTVANDITYYPPPIARKILESAVEGPGGARVPAPREALLSFIYHVLYHKGYFAGVASTLDPAKVNPNPENDYAGEIVRLAKAAGVEVDSTMEALDEYLAKEGWRPKLDTLAKIAPKNRWVRDRFFSRSNQEELGLGVVILKQRTIESGIVDDIVRAIKDAPGFRTLRIKHFNAQEVAHAARELRGGVWLDAQAGTHDLMPAVAIAVFDQETAALAKAGTHLRRNDRLRSLKIRLRERFDSGTGSLIHATDSTQESWEYLAVAFPVEAEVVRHEVRAAYNAVPISVAHTWARHLHATRTVLAGLFVRLRAAVIQLVSR